MSDDKTQPDDTGGEQATDTFSASADSLFKPNAVQVIAKCAHFRRAGREFTRDAVTIPLSELDEATFNALYHEPMLALQLVHIPQES